MSEIATIALPFFGLILLGYAIGHWGPLKAETFVGLQFFVRYVALPVLYFQLLARTPFDQFASWSFILTTTFATYCAFAIAFSFGALINHGRVPEATIQGLAGSFSNSGYLAPGLTLAAFGTAAATPTALIFAFDFAVLVALTPLMMMLGATERVAVKETFRKIARDIVLHPLILAILLGFAFSAFGLWLPGPVEAGLALLGSAAAPCALFVTGLMLAQRPVVQVTSDVPVLIGTKLIVHPLIVYLLLSWIGGFDRVWVATAILMAALPPAADVIAVARQYGSYAAQASTAFLFDAAAAVATLTITLVLVVLNLLPVDPF